MNRNLAIVPAHNEAEAIVATITAIGRWAPDFDVLVVDDGSTDATAERASQAGAAVLRLPFNLGIGGAMQSGYMYAASTATRSPCRSTATASTTPATSTSCSRGCEGDPGLNMVTGSRFLESEAGGHRSSAARRVGIRVFARVVSLITGQRVTDPTSGFRMTDRRGIELFARDYPHDYPEVEAILLMHAHRLRSCEIPVVMRPRLTGVVGDLLDAVGLLHGEGAARGVRGAVPRAARVEPARPQSVAVRRALVTHEHAVAARDPARRGDCSGGLICLLIFELVRRKRLMERYAILWLVAGVTVLVLALWQGLLTTLSHAAGIYYPPSALFAVAFLFVLVMLVHFSMAVSRLSDQNKVLAQRLALLQQQLEREQEAGAARRRCRSEEPPQPR